MKRIAAATAVGLVLLAAGAAPGVQAADTCPNAEYRGGAGANLPDCRAWEQVTPVDKGGNQTRYVVGVYASPDGNTVLSSSTGDISGANGLPFQGFFSSARSSAWTTGGLDASFDPPLPGPGTGITSQSAIGFSEDRSKALTASTQKLTPDASEGDSNVYVRDTTTRAYTLIATNPGPTLVSSLQSISSVFDAFTGGSPDLRHAVVASGKALEPNSDGGGLYLVGDGRVTLASRGVDGNPVQGVQRPQNPVSGARVVSDDGRRVTFRAYDSNLGQTVAYQRVDGTSTKLISRSHRAADGTNTPVPIVNSDGAVWPSADGRQVIFETAGETTLNDNQPPATVYRWNAADDTVADLFAGTTRPWSSVARDFGLLEVSPDGRYVWFALTDIDGTGTEVRQIDVLDTQTRRIVTKQTGSLNQPISLFDSASFSRDGTKLVTLSRRALTGYDQSSGPCAAGAGGSCTEAFLYDATTPDYGPTCASCGAPGTQAVNDVDLGTVFPGRPLGTIVSDTGSVAFGSFQRLVPADVNGGRDVYVSSPGRLPALISSGSGRYDANVAGITPSARDVLFTTGDSLVPQDEDRGAVDVYDARVDGGLAVQQIASGRTDSCPTASCPGPQPSVPAPEAPGSLTFHAPARPPAFRVSAVTAAARRAAVVSGRLKVAVRVGGAGRLSARATARLGRRPTTVGRASASARRSGRYVLAMTLTRAARRALAKGSSLRLSLTVTYSRAADPARQSFSLTASRTARSSRGGAR